MQSIEEMGKRAKEASRFLLTQSADKDKALVTMAKKMEDRSDAILEENRRDIERAKGEGLSDAFIDRIQLCEERIREIAHGLRSIASLDDPISCIRSGRRLPNGLEILKVSVPIGVVGMIYEARPNVTADAAGLCLKSGNAVILRGGKEAIFTNSCIVGCMREALREVGFPMDCIQFIEDTSRESAMALMGLRQYLDLLIPRGGRGLIQSVIEHAKVPVIETGEGNCHIFVDDDASIEKALAIIDNAKTSRPSVCNAVETVLVHSAIADRFLPQLRCVLDQKSVEIRGCEKTCEILGSGVSKAVEEDYRTEFLDSIIAIKIVDGFHDAVDHIRRYSSGHSEAIITENYSRAELFTREIDAAVVYVNASTRFTDGSQFGLGAEIGISTQKLHARGPMGIQELTSTKYIVHGNGQIR